MHYYTSYCRANSFVSRTSTSGQVRTRWLKKICSQDAFTRRAWKICVTSGDTQFDSHGAARAGNVNDHRNSCFDSTTSEVNEAFALHRKFVPDGDFQNAIEQEIWNNRGMRGTNENLQWLRYCRMLVDLNFVYFFLSACFFKTSHTS